MREIASQVTILCKMARNMLRGSPFVYGSPMSRSPEWHSCKVVNFVSRPLSHLFTDTGAGERVKNHQHL